MSVVTSTGTVTVNAAFLQEIKEVNQELWSLLAELRHRCQRPIAPGHCRQLIDKISLLRDQLALHFSLEEAYGYFDDPVDVAPQLSRQAEHLRSEHRELYQDFNAAFAAHWKGKTGQAVKVNQSHGGSGKQARAVIDGRCRRFFARRTGDRHGSSILSSRAELVWHIARTCASPNPAASSSSRKRRRPSTGVAYWGMPKSLASTF